MRAYMYRAHVCTLANIMMHEMADKQTPQEL